MNCQNVINGHFLNRCFALKYAPKMKVPTTNIFNFLRPAHLLSIMIIVLLILPFIFSKSSRQSYGKTLRLYNIVRYSLLSILHRISYALTLFPILQYFIKQPMPCECSDLHFSKSQANMPYIYTHVTIVFAFYIFNLKTFFPKIAYFIGILLIALPNITYILTGFVSVAQVLASGFFSAFLYLYSSSTSSIFLIIEHSIFLIFSITLLIISYRNHQSTFYQTFYRSILMSVEMLFLIIKFFHRNSWSYLTIPKGALLYETEGQVIRSSLLEQDNEANQFYTAIRIDKIDSLIAFMITLTEVMIEEYLKKNK